MHYMGGKMNLVVHLNGVEVILVPYRIRPLIGPFKPLLIHLPMAPGGSVMAGLISMLIGH